MNDHSKFLVPEIIERANAITAVAKKSKKTEQDVKKVMLSKMRHLGKIKAQSQSLSDCINLMETKEKKLLQKRNTLVTNFKSISQKNSSIEQYSMESMMEFTKQLDDFNIKSDWNTFMTKLIGGDLPKKNVEEEIVLLERTCDEQMEHIGVCPVLDFVSTDLELINKKNKQLKGEIKVMTDKKIRLEAELTELRGNIPFANSFEMQI